MLVGNILSEAASKVGWVSYAYSSEIFCAISRGEINHFIGLTVSLFVAGIDAGFIWFYELFSYSSWVDCRPGHGEPFIAKSLRSPLRTFGPRWQGLGTLSLPRELWLRVTTSFI